jgi:hypothetical protein
MYSRSRIVPATVSSSFSSDLSLDVDRHHHPVEVLALVPLGDPFESVLEADSQARLDQHALELRRDGLGALPDHRVDRLGQREPGRERPGHQLQRLGEPGVEGLAPSRSLDAEVDPRDDRAGDQEEQPEHEAPLAEQQPDHARTDEDAGVHQQPLGRLERAARALQPGGDLRLQAGVALQHLGGGVPGLDQCLVGLHFRGRCEPTA